MSEKEDGEKIEFFRKPSQEKSRSGIHKLCVIDYDISSEWLKKKWVS